MNNLNNEKDDQSEGFTPKYSKPNILLIDMPDNVLSALHSAGFNALSGTFGVPYKIEANDDFIPLQIDYNLPNCNEQEVIFIDLDSPEILLEVPEVEYNLSNSNKWWWTNSKNGKIDYAPLIQEIHRKSFDRVLKHGGIFVIFAKSRYDTEIGYGKRGSALSRSKYANWSFLSDLNPQNLTIEYDSGKEIKILNTEISKFLKKYVKNVDYNAKFTANSWYKFNERWIPLMCNKFDECIGGIIGPTNTVKGWIIILPQMSKTPSFILGLLNEILPNLSPKLFPYAEGKNWINREEYALSSILDLKTKKNKVIQDSEKKIKELDQKILADKRKYDFIYRILTGTGDDLVDDIEKCLKFIGFKKVHNVDKELEAGGKHRKQEDLQICDRSPILVEIKGINGYPSEDDMGQVSKYVLRRAREWNRTDVRGISIINHYRNIPAIERDDAFSKPQIEDAKNSEVTILTTWDLFLLIKGMIEWDWDPKTVQDLFYKTGRMSKVPTHYKPIGKISKYWGTAKAISIELNAKICKGDRVGYFLQNGFLEEDVLSLKLDGKDVEEINQGLKAGIKTIYPKSTLKKGTIVYKVNN